MTSDCRTVDDVWILMTSDCRTVDDVWIVMTSDGRTVDDVGGMEMECGGEAPCGV